MTDHLPECPVAGIKPTAYDYAERAYYDCICDRLRACEQRVRDEPFGDSGKALLDKGYVAGREDERRALFDDEGPYTAGFNTGVQCARDAVAAALNVVVVFGSAYVNRFDALAAIDALRQNDNETVTDLTRGDA